MKRWGQPSTRTDPDAKNMTKPAHNLMAYNVQIAVDDKMKIPRTLGSRNFIANQTLLFAIKSLHYRSKQYNHSKVHYIFTNTPILLYYCPHKPLIPPTRNCAAMAPTTRPMIRVKIFIPVMPSILLIAPAYRSVKKMVIDANNRERLTIL